MLSTLEAIVEARKSCRSTFRFIYVSGIGVPRDLSKKPKFMSDYVLVRVSIDFIEQLYDIAILTVGRVR